MYIKPPNLDSSGIDAFFTTRYFPGLEHGSAETFLAGKPDSIYLPVQKHTGTVHVLDSDLGPVVADAVVTSRKNVLIGIRVADCVPVLMYDREKQIIGAVHAGWKGTAQRIIANTVKTMREEFGCSAGDISAAIGPSIRQCSYEVGEEVMGRVMEATGEGDYYSKNGGKCSLDLSRANRIQALSAGVREGNIWQSGECTFCSHERFYSYRHSKDTGRQGGFIVMW